MNKIEQSYILAPQYEDYLLKKGVKSKETRGYHYFHPSSFGDCLRKVVLQYFGETNEGLKEPREIEPRAERIFDAGHAHHFRMQKAYADMGILRGYWRSKISGKVYGTEDKLGIFRPQTLEEVGEKKLEGDDRAVEDLFEYEEIKVGNAEYNLFGHCDGVVELEKGNEATRYVVDFKTSKIESFSLIASKTRRPDAKYITQINIYMFLLGIKQGIIAYEDKNTHQLMEFLVPFDETLVEQIKKNAKILMELIEKKQIPKVPSQYTEKTKPCMYCGYCDFCYKRKK